MTAQEALQLLRINPARAFRECAFMVEEDIGWSGSCDFEISDLPDAGDPNMFLISPVQNAAARFSYFYAAVNDGANRVGSCRVPKDCLDGTLVFTGGMNGCSFQVNDGEHELLFQHCYNGAAGMAGPILSRIDGLDYMGRETARAHWQGFDACTAHLPTGKTIFHFAYHPIAVKILGIWYVYFSGIVSRKRVASDPNERLEYRKIMGTTEIGRYLLSVFNPAR